jgi:hypothetical protein
LETPAVAQWFFKYGAEFKDNLATGGWVCWGACYGEMSTEYMNKMKSATGVEKIWASNGPVTGYNSYRGPFVFGPKQGGAWMEK